ncbi:uncharacterized protein with ParB-like and HNH nuclease domain [Clostridium saccharobutylicum]|nr:DUF262 domain-containing protein [Clostridium saccharobutylicum]NOW56374.1 uncharacterized protein with ParB-like and HNH nuclease domain [Clostridium saccharobutylicum]
MNKIIGSPVEVNKLFNNRYTVHYYQREYSWQEKQIKELIDDLANEFIEYYQEGDSIQDVEKYGDYF